MLTTKLVNFLITSKCTLNCLLCSTAVTLYKKPTHEGVETIRQEVDTLFKIYDHIDGIDIMGGEPMMHPNLDKILDLFFPYKNKYGRLRIVTNATILPNEKIIASCKKNEKIMFLLDHYGELSLKIAEIETSLKSHAINYATNIYFGKDMHCDGWVDMGDYKHKNYSNKQLLDVYNTCHLAKLPCLMVKNGYIYLCATAAIGEDLSLFEVNESEKVSLLGEITDIAHLRSHADSFWRKPINACYHCNGFDVEKSKRYPAAVQLERGV